VYSDKYFSNTAAKVELFYRLFGQNLSA